MKSPILTIIANFKRYLHGGFHEEPRISPVFRQILVASGPLISTVSLGMTSGYSAVLLPQLQAPGSTLKVDQTEASWIASMAVLPMAFGCLLGGYLMEKLGRKTTQIITTVPCFIGWLIITLASNTLMLMIGRFFTGLCGGLLGPSTGVYISETSDPKYRGFLLAGISLAISLGLFLVHILGTFLTWSSTAFACAVVPLVSVTLLLLVPESPAWLAKTGKVVDAQNSFYWCRGQSDETKAELAELIQRQSNKQEVEGVSWDNQFFKPLIIIVVFIVTNQWAGVNALTFYTVSIMKTTLRGFDEYWAMLIVDAIRVIMSVITCVIMKKMGRRPLALISGTGTTAALFTLSIYTYVTDEYPIIPMVALVAYISFISVGFVPLPWAMMGELFPLVHRNVGSSVSSFMAFIAFFSVVKTSPFMFEELGADGTFLIYGSVAFLGTVFIFFVLPETKDKTLHQIEDQFKNKCDNDGV